MLEVGNTREIGDVEIQDLLTLQLRGPRLVESWSSGICAWYSPGLQPLGIIISVNDACLT